MSKKKEASNIDELLIKEFGDIIASPEDIKNINYKIIPTTPKLDIALGGGISEGTLTVISAAPKFGKTTLALQIAKNALEVDTDEGPRECYYLSIESRIKERDLYGIKGLDHSRVKIIKSTAGHILSGEDFLKIGEKILNSRPGAVVIFDSFSALCSHERQESDLSERFRDNMPLVLGSFCRKIAPIISVNKSIAIAINHMYANASGKGHKTWLEGSGQKVQYGLDQKLLGAFTKPWLNQQGDQIGLEVIWKVATTYLANSKLGDISTFLKFGEGYSGIQEYMELASDIGVIDKKGAGWYTYKDMKIQGADQFRTLIENNADMYKDIKDQVDNMFSKVKT